MKKILFILVAFIICFYISNDSLEFQKIEVSLSYVVDGDTMIFDENGVENKYRLLMVDTPENTSEIEYLGNEAYLYAKELLENASIIEIEYQEDNEVLDKYQRKLVWVFVDGKLLQEELAKKGYVKEVLYDNGGNYTYEKQIEKALEYAKEHQLGLYEKAPG